MLASTFGQVLAGFTAANVLSRAVSTLTDMGREALATAGSLVDLSNKTGLSTETLQRMQFVAKQSGSDMGAFADAAFKMGVNIEEGTAKARKGAEALGLSWTDLREASPDAQFNMVVQALERMEDPQKRNEAAVALFGKTAKEILPAIVDGYSKVAEGATVAGDAQVRALDAAGDAWDRFKARMVSGTINAIGNQLLLNEATANLTKGEKDFILQTIEGSKTIEAYNAALIRFYQAKQKAKDIDTSSWFVKPTAAASFVADLKAAEAGYAALTKTQREELFTALQLNKSNDEIIDSLGITADVLAIGKKAYEAHKRAVDEAAASQKKLTQSLEAARVAHVPLTEAQAARVRSLLALTLSEDEAARLAGVHVIQVRQYIAAQKDAAEAEKLLLRVRLDAEKATEKLDAAAADRLHQRTGAIGQGMIEALKVETAARLEAKDLRLKASVDEFTYQQIKLEEWVAAEKAKLAEQVGDHSRAYDAIDELAQEKFAAIARAHDDALEKMRSQELTWGKGFADIIGGVPQLLTQAFTGGGGMSGFAKAFATGGGAMAGGVLGGQLQDVFFSKLAPKMVDGFGATFTQAIGDSIPYIGAAIGALAPVVLGGFKKLFGGVSEEEKKGRETV
ncbi:MAG TPA: hypothetical protein VE665_02450, partial [Hyphomicrobiaceae bacterium]|nr:hypothetical protein [Hyphomicrobiaceae bacterium]